MDYKTIDDYTIEIAPGETPVKELFETMAKVSYELAHPVGMGHLQPFETPVEEVDFSLFFRTEPIFQKREWFNWLLGPKLVGEKISSLDMDYVNGRKCKTYVAKNEEGKLQFNSLAFQDRGSPESFLEKVKAKLEGIIDDSAVTTKKPLYWDRIESFASEYGIKVDQNSARKSRLRVALILDQAGRQIEAVEIMTGRPFEPHGIDGALLMDYKIRRDSAERFYDGFAPIDRT